MASDGTVGTPIGEGQIVTESDYDAVRYLLGVPSGSLPDAVISSEVNLTFVETKVKEMVDGWNTATGFDEIKDEASSNWTYVRVGTMAFLAAWMVPYVMMQEATSFSAGGYSESGRKFEWEQKAKDLIGKARDAFSLVSTRTLGRDTLMVVSGPTSSGAALPEGWEEWEEMILPRIVDFAEEGESEDDTFWSESR